MSIIAIEARIYNILSLNISIIDELLVIYLINPLRYIILVDYRLKYFSR